MREDCAFGRYHEIIGPECFALAVAARQPQVHRSITLEGAVASLREVPEAIGVEGHDGIIGAAQRSIRADAEVCPADQHRQFAVHRTKGESDQLPVIVVRPRAALRTPGRACLIAGNARI